MIPFLVVFLAYAVALGSLLLAYPKGAMELWVNQHIRADAFFFWITYLGDGVLYIITALLLGAKNKRWAVFALACFAFTSAVAQFLKIVVFPDAPRPQMFFGEKAPLHYVAGVEIYISNSFPSGHTVSAFSLAMVLSLLFRQGWISVLCVVLAILVGFSRVYLLQHFFVDTYFGAWMGVLGTWAVYYALRKFVRKE